MLIGGEGEVIRRIIKYDKKCIIGSIVPLKLFGKEIEYKKYILV